MSCARAIDVARLRRAPRQFLQAFDHDELDAALLRLPAVGFIE